LPVITQKFVKINILHIAVNVWHRPTGVNKPATRLTKD
jgi:hypothetical protein